MADKKFTNKVGLDNLLDFDPINGILKYGSYEVFAKDVGVAPTRTEVTFDSYLNYIKPDFTGAGSYAVSQPTPQETAKQREQFEAAVMDGTFYGQPKRVIQGAGDYAAPSAPTGIRNVSRLGPDSFSVETYNIPNTVDLVNKIGERAQGLKYQGDDGALLQNQSDAKNRRQGRASTVLSPSAATTVNA